jgi:hypothetical protein
MDRQDIDALLIGALYGELTPAEEARLAAHLESHPTDRGALDDLKVARQAVHDSRIFAVQLEPAQHVSALLLQEAHRRAPRRAVADDGQPARDGWFYRFARSFMAHPAMAAAAMLVLVLGGAGIVYMKKGDQFVEYQPSSSVTDNTAGGAPAAEAPSDEPKPEPALEAQTGAAYNADLYEGAAGEDRDGARDSKLDQAADASERRRELEQKRPAEESAQQAAPARGIAVGTAKGAPKDLPAAKESAAPAKRKARSDLGFGAADDDGMAPSGGAAAGGSKSGSISTDAVDRAASETRYAQPPPPARPSSAAPSAPAPTTTAAPQKKAEAISAGAAADAAPAQRDDALIAWAKSEHKRAVALAAKGDCTAAAKVALGVSNRASDYYAQFMSTDRALRSCATYINAERDRDAERSGKTRAQKNTNAESPAPAKQ